MPQVAWAPWRARCDFNGGVRAARSPPLKSNREKIEDCICGGFSAVRHVGALPRYG